MTRYRVIEPLVLRCPILPTSGDSLNDDLALAAEEAAIAWASPSLLRARTEDRPGWEASWHRYATRMRRRPTPNGLLASVSLCELGQETNVRLPELDAYQVWPSTIEPSESKGFVPNPTLRLEGDRIVGRAPDDPYDAISVRAQEQIVRTLLLGAGTAGLPNDMVQALAGSGFLLDESSHASLTATRVQASIRFEDAMRIRPPDRVDAITATPPVGQISRCVGRDIADLAYHLAASLSPRSDRLTSMKSDFRLRYEAGAVPLLEALDPESGVQIRFDAGENNSEAMDTTLLDLLARARHEHGVYRTTVDEGRVDQRPTDSSRVSPSLDLFVGVDALDVASINKGDYRLVLRPRGTSMQGGQALGRFSSMLGPAIRRGIRAAHNAERRFAGASIITELDYRPRSSEVLGVVLRPGLSSTVDRVTSVNCVSADAAHELRLDQLWLQLVSDEFVITLDSGEIVQFASTHLLNPSYAPPVAAFLDAVANQGRYFGGPFSWGKFAGLPDLPEVSVGHLVLAPRTRNVYRGALAERIGELSSDDHLVEWMTARFDLPEVVDVGRSDTLLTLDLRDPGDRHQLAGLARTSFTKSRRLVIADASLHAGNAWIPGPLGMHVGELVATVASDAEATRDVGLHPQRNNHQGHRPIQSSWVSVKLYLHPSSMDDYVADTLLPLLEDPTHRGGYYLRYRDPAPHVRFRCRIDTSEIGSQDHLADLMSRLTSPSAVNEVVLDTYFPEIERYGGLAHLADAEHLFHLDSLFVVQQLAQWRPNGPDEFRLRVASSLVQYLFRLVGDGLQQFLARLPRSGTPALAGGELYRSSSTALCAEYEEFEVDGHSDFVDRNPERDAEVRSAGGRLADGLTTERFYSVVDSLLHMHTNRWGLDRFGEEVALSVVRRIIHSVSARRQVPG